MEAGNTATPGARTDVSRYSNRTQIAEDVLSITKTQQAVQKAGGKDEVAYQETKAMVALKKDIEFGVLQNTTAIAAASGTAPQARGFLGFIATNTSKATAGTAGVDPNPLTNTAQTDGTLRNFTEALLKDVMKLRFDNGAETDNIYAMIPSALRSTADGFLAGQTRFDKAEDKALTATLEVYIGPFGRVKFVNARHMRARDVFLIDPQYAALGTLRGMKSTPLGVRGDADERLINCEWTLLVKNEKGHGAIRDVQAV